MWQGSVVSMRASVGGREVTLIELETVETLFREVVNAEGGALGINLSPAETRRNIATSGMPLNHLVDREFWVALAVASVTIGALARRAGYSRSIARRKPEPTPASAWNRSPRILDELVGQHRAEDADGQP